MNTTKLEGTSLPLKYVLTTLLLALATVYIYNANTAIGFGDALGFVWALEKDGFDWSTNATSHFGYINAIKLFTYTLPFLSDFNIATAFSIVFAIATVCILYKILMLITKHHLTTILATLTFAFSFTFWRQTEIVEVYTFNLFVYGLMLFLAIKIYFKQSNHSLLLSCLLGIAIVIHVKNILLFPFLVYVIYLDNKSFAKTFFSLVPTIAVASLLLIIPFFTKLNTYTSVFFENDGVLALAIDHGIMFYFKSGIKHTGYLIYNFHIYLIFAFFGIRLLLKKDIYLLLLLLLAGLPFFLFSIVFDVPDAYVYSLPFYVVITVFIGLGVYLFLTRFNFSALVLLLTFFLLSPLFYFSIYKITTFSNVPAISKIDTEKNYKGGLKYLLWPGMRDNASLLSITKNIQTMEEKPFYYEDMEWNYLMTVKYLKWKKVNAENIH